MSAAKNVWQFNEYQVSVGDKGLVFTTKKTTAEVGWRHIVSAEYENRSPIRVGLLVAGIALIVISFFFSYGLQLFVLFLLVGILLIMLSIRRRKFIGRIKVATGDTYQLSGDATELEEFLSMIRKKVWGK